MYIFSAKCGSFNHFTNFQFCLGGVEMRKNKLFEKVNISAH